MFPNVTERIGRLFFEEYILEGPDGQYNAMKTSPLTHPT
jgi:hypothetical protein